MSGAIGDAPPSAKSDGGISRGSQPLLGKHDIKGGQGRLALFKETVPTRRAYDWHGARWLTIRVDPRYAGEEFDPPLVSYLQVSEVRRVGHEAVKPEAVVPPSLPREKGISNWRSFGSWRFGRPGPLAHNLRRREGHDKGPAKVIEPRMTNLFSPLDRAADVARRKQLDDPPKIFPPLLGLNKQFGSRKLGRKGHGGLLALTEGIVAVQ